MNYDDYSSLIPDWQNQRAAEQIRKGQVPRNWFGQSPEEAAAADITDLGEGAVKPPAVEVAPPITPAVPAVPVAPDSPLARPVRAVIPDPKKLTSAAIDYMGGPIGQGAPKYGEFADVLDQQHPVSDPSSGSHVRVTVGGKTYDYGGGAAGNAPMQTADAGPGAGEGFGRTWNQSGQGGVSVMGKPFVDPNDIEEAMKARTLRDLSEDPYTAYRRRADIDRQKAVGIAEGTEQAKDAVRGRREQSIQADLTAIDEEASNNIAALKNDPRYTAATPDKQIEAEEHLKAKAAAKRAARLQAAGIATGNAPSEMFKPPLG